MYPFGMIRNKGYLKAVGNLCLRLIFSAGFRTYLVFVISPLRSRPLWTFSMAFLIASSGFLISTLTATFSPKLLKTTTLFLPQSFFVILYPFSKKIFVKKNRLSRKRYFPNISDFTLSQKFVNTPVDNFLKKRNFSNVILSVAKDLIDR